jgi:hypothetical protein
MGAGASTLNRLRKAIVIRAYNLRKPNETIEEQFRPHAFRGENNALCIGVDSIRICLNMDSKEFEWIEHFFQHAFGGKVFLLCSKSEYAVEFTDFFVFVQVSSINFQDFIRFLESGKAVSCVIGSFIQHFFPDTKMNSVCMFEKPLLDADPKVLINPVTRKVSKVNGSDTISSMSGADSVESSNKKWPPTPPSTNSMNQSQCNSSIADPSTFTISPAPDRLEAVTSASSHGVALATDDEVQVEDNHAGPQQEVIHINLSQVSRNPDALSGPVKLRVEGKIILCHVTKTPPTLFAQHHC